MIRTHAIAALALAASGCALDADDPGAETLLVPTSLELHWSEAFNGLDDGLGAVVPVDVMVYDSATGEPRGGAAIEVHPPRGVTVLTEGDLARIEPESCEDCALFWDAYRDQYYLVLVDPAELGVVRLRTDSQGLARAFLVVDMFEPRAGEFAPSRVHVLGASADAVVLLVPR
jgi:hypothetical protein